ncbi:MAG: ATP-binding cassette domain-containing protein [Verrucomicrobiota bacterium JB023]|nr:ATP-binding cassette domain-containing protein [Verrucomicrobiota bacterium JB023]
MFELKSVRVEFGGLVALADIDLRIESGEQVCLIGPSGAGKSTLLGLFNGRVMATRGEVRAEGENLSQFSPAKLRALRQRIAWVPQDLGLVPNLRVNQNVSCGRAGAKGFWGLMRSYLRMSGEEQEKIHALLQRVGIPEKLFERVDHLSGGQQQRVAIARALYQKPKAILADEPVSAVDPERARDLVELLTSAAREEGASLIMSLHDVSLARRYFDRVIGLREGRIVFDGPAHEEGVKTLYRLTE